MLTGEQYMGTVNTYQGINTPPERSEIRMIPAISQDLAEHEYLRSVLKSDYPEIDDETLRDTVEGLTNLAEILAAVVRSHLDDLALTTALRARISTMQERLSRLEDRIEKKRTLVASVMERADIRKLSQPDFTVSLRSTAAPLVVLSESEIPEPFWRPQPPKLDRKGLLAALISGQSVPGVTLGNGAVTIAVRTG